MLYIIDYFPYVTVTYKYPLFVDHRTFGIDRTSR